MTPGKRSPKRSPTATSLSRIGLPACPLIVFWNRPDLRRREPRMRLQAYSFAWAARRLLLADRFHSISVLTQLPHEKVSPPGLGQIFLTDMIDIQRDQPPPCTRLNLVVMAENKIGMQFIVHALCLRHRPRLHLPPWPRQPFLHEILRLQRNRIAAMNSALKTVVIYVSSDEIVDINTGMHELNDQPVRRQAEGRAIVIQIEPVFD